MGWQDKIQSARESGQKAFDHQTDAVVKQYWPQIQTVFKEKVGPAALAAARDDHKMELLFRTVYAALPFPVHFAVKEAAFIKFCFAHRDQLLPPDEAKAVATGS